MREATSPSVVGFVFAVDFFSCFFLSSATRRVWSPRSIASAAAFSTLASPGLFFAAVRRNWIVRARSSETPCRRPLLNCCPAVLRVMLGKPGTAPNAPKGLPPSHQHPVRPSPRAASDRSALWKSRERADAPGHAPTAAVWAAPDQLVTVRWIVSDAPSPSLALLLQRLETPFNYSPSNKQLHLQLLV